MLLPKGTRPPRNKTVRVPSDIKLVAMNHMTGLYVGGRLVAEEPEISAARLLELLGVPFDAFTLGNDHPVSARQGVLPPKFKHVPLEFGDREDD